MRACFLLCFLVVCGARDANRNGSISASVAPAFFNPTLGQSAKLKLAIPVSGLLSVQVIDRDGFSVTSLVHDRRVSAGPVELQWTGRDAKGNVVPDEAYSVRADLRTARGLLTYFPAAAPAPMYDVPVTSYDRREGSLTYTLPKPSRVHIQAGTAKRDPITKDLEGPVMKTIVDREPRSAGSIVEMWDGMAEGGEVVVPALPDFVTGVACTPLPDSSFITVGNRSTTFREYARKRTGKSLLTATGTGAAHSGLNSLEDFSPALTLRLTPGANPTTYGVQVDAPANDAAVLGRHGGTVYCFVDGRRSLSMPARSLPFTLNIPGEDLTPGPHVLTVNWATGHGPTAVGVLRVVSPQPAPKTAEIAR